MNMIHDRPFLDHVYTFSIIFADKKLRIFLKQTFKSGICLIILRLLHSAPSFMINYWLKHHLLK